ncbi:MAG: DASS family sodium-coupled anion symporter [Gammaproteobacteria bacterium]|nr:DASS family sodium-coupled anion symporter [Gammaproteobacteria bacterium]
MPTSESLTPAALHVAAIATLMAVWWVTEPVPIPITALIPIALFPTFDVMSVHQVTSNYANHIIFLFLGGFIIALCFERWNLHKRIALYVISIVGNSQKRILLGFMLATALLSMWVSNTATTLMMIPVVVAVIKKIDESGESIFGMTLMLGVAYSASIGGVSTLIGTPPNAILAGVLEQQLNISISFFDWLVFALPLSLIFLALTWVYLCYLQKKEHIHIKPLDKAVIKDELAKLGQITPEEKKILGVFILVALAWIARGLIDIEFFKQIKDSTIAIFGAILLFIIPAKNRSTRLMDWDTAKKLPWDILLLFGGGFALASGFSETGLTTWIGGQLNFLADVNILFIILAVSLLVIFLTEVTSNTATASLLIPIMVGLSEVMQLPPMYLMATVAISASCAFMLPVATPPNAIVYSSRFVTIQQMAKTGFLLNILGSLLITLFIVRFLPWVFSLG